MQKLTKNEFGLSSKHELWNKIKELEALLESNNLTFMCNQSDFDALNQHIHDLDQEISILKLENEKLRSHNDFLLSQLSGYSPKTINFK